MHWYSTWIVFFESILIRRLRILKTLCQMITARTFKDLPQNTSNHDITTLKVISPEILFSILTKTEVNYKHSSKANPFVSTTTIHTISSPRLWMIFILSRKNRVNQISKSEELSILVRSEVSTSQSQGIWNQYSICRSFFESDVFCQYWNWKKKKKKKKKHYLNYIYVILEIFVVWCNLIFWIHVIDHEKI